MMQVLIVDDDIATVDVIKEKINWDALEIGQVYTAYNILQAKEILTAHEISVVISDIEMPQGNGIDLLSWFREQKMQGEFLLLTCHESFDYAANALKLQAAEYLLKPFDVLVMEAALRKLIYKIKEDGKRREELEYGRWAQSNRRQMQLSFIRMALEGRIEKQIDTEIRERNLSLNAEQAYRLVVSRVTEVERAQERMTPGLLGFVLENIHSEVFFGDPENSRVVSMDLRDSYSLTCVCDDAGTDGDFEKRAREAIWQVRQISGAVVTCCISVPAKIEDFNRVSMHCRKLLTSSVAYYGSCFFESRVEDSGENGGSILDTERLVSFLENKDKAGFMGYMKKALSDKMFDKSLNAQMLRAADREVWQAVYTYFAKKGIGADKFFKDDTADALAQKANRSVMDMLRMVNYLLEQLYQYETEAGKEKLPLTRIKQFIREHYMENIGRTQIADELCLAPEYVSKLFKKESGMNLSDYIAGYRVLQAKNLLDRGDMSVSEVAEACGFENATYFSTTFKKHTGISPNQYRKLENK